MLPNLAHLKLVPHLTVLIKILISLHVGSLSLWICAFTTVLLMHGECSYNENKAVGKFYMKFLIPFWEPIFHWASKRGTESSTHYLKMPGKIFLRSFLLVSRIQYSYHSGSICLRNTLHVRCSAIKYLIDSPNYFLQTDDKKDEYTDRW